MPELGRSGFWRTLWAIFVDGPFSNDWATKEPDPERFPELHRNWLAAHSERTSRGRSRLGQFVCRVIGHLRGQRTDSSPVPEPRHLLDALRRSTELLDGMEPANGTTYWREERDYIVAVNRRLLREHDPEATTDGAVC